MKTRRSSSMVWIAVPILAVWVYGMPAEGVEIDRTGTRVVAASSEINGGESARMVFDDDINTKWLTAGGQTTGTLTYDFVDDQTFALDGYSITSANDAPDRSPNDWTFEGSDNGTTWTVLDTRTGEGFDPNIGVLWTTFEKKNYSFSNSTAYKMYRLNVTANSGSGNLMGLSEMELLEGVADRSNVGTISVTNQINNGEGRNSLIDNTSATKWLTAGGNSTGIATFQFPNGNAFAVNKYAITSANDAPGRDPRNWDFQGSNNGITWTTVDSRSGESWPNRFQRREFPFDNPIAYEYYRLNVTANNGDGGLMGFSELELLEVVVDPTLTTFFPADGSSVAANPLELSWETFRTGATPTFTVQLGTDPGNLNPAVSGLTERNWVVPEVSIVDGQTYYWRVDIVDDPNDEGSTDTFIGDVHSFCVVRSTSKALEWNMDSLGVDAVAYSYEDAITDITALASSEEQGNRSADQTIGSFGLIIDPTISDPNGLTHINSATTMWISAPDEFDTDGPAWIQYTFDQIYSLGTMHIWNHNVGAPFQNELDRGMREVIISYSTVGGTDPNDYTELGGFEIPIGTGLDGLTPSLAVDFGGINAIAVRITGDDTNGNSNWGGVGGNENGKFYALSEVRFGKFGEPLLAQATVSDSSGNGNDGRTYGDPQIVNEAIMGQAMNFDGDDQVFMIQTEPNAIAALPLSDGGDCEDNWSMNFYVLLSEALPSPTLIAGFGGTETGAGRYIGNFADGIHFWGGANVDGPTNVPFDINRWQMITVVYDGGTLNIYKNAEEIFSQPLDLGEATPVASVSTFDPFGLPAFNGIIDEFVIYNGALTQTQIDALRGNLPTNLSALNPTPANGAVNVPIDPILGWDAPLDAISPTFDVFLGTAPDALNLLASGLTDSSYDTIGSPLAYETTYYWQVDTSTGDPSEVWSFTTLPASGMSTLALEWTFDSLTNHNHTFEQAIENVMATASSEEGANRSVDRAVNEVGLAVVPVIADPNALQHSNDADHMWIADPGQVGTVWIQFDFDQVYSLGTMHIWNHNVGAPFENELDRGMRNVIISYSLVGGDDPNDYTDLGNFEIPIGTGLNDLTPSLAIDFGGTNAIAVRITAAASSSNWGATGNFHALSEVRFGIAGTNAVSVSVDDTSGNGNIGALVQDPEFVAGLISGQAVELESVNIESSGLGDRINALIANASVLPLSASDLWSMNLYVNLPAEPANLTLFAGFGGSGGTGAFRYIGHFGQLWFWGDNIDLFGGPYRCGHWQMMTVTYDGTTLRIYLNGDEVASGPPNNAFVDASEFVTVAGLTPWNNPMEGLVDNFTLYRGVLTRTEIAALAAILPPTGDLDWDGLVNFADLLLWVPHWLDPLDDCSPYDFNGDGAVNALDFAELADNYQ